MTDTLLDAGVGGAAALAVVGVYHAFAARRGRTAEAVARRALVAAADGAAVHDHVWSAQPVDHRDHWRVYACQVPGCCERKFQTGAG